MLWFKKPLIVDCYTTDPFVYENSKIRSGVHFFPDWWKKLRSSGKDGWKGSFQIDSDYQLLAGTNTMKSCPGFINIYKKSFVLPLWSDLRVRVNSLQKIKEGFASYSYQFADRNSDIDDHPSLEHNNHFSDEEYQHLKIISPWSIICNKPISWAWVPPVWHLTNDLEPVTVLSGVVDYCYQAATNINLFIKRPKEGDLFLEFPFNLPLVHIIPLTESKIKLNYHLVTHDELTRIKAKRGVRGNTFFNSAYFKHKNYRG